MTDYRDGVIAALRQHFTSVSFQPGRVHHIEILHAEDCRRWCGWRCDCTPKIQSGKPVDDQFEAER